MVEAMSELAFEGGHAPPSPLWGGTEGGGMSVPRARELRKIMSGPEAKLWNGLRALRPLGHHFRRQVPLGRYIADFCCHRVRLVIEVDGDTHFGDEAEARDVARDAFIRREGYRVLRVTNVDVMRNLDGVMAAIVSALDPPPPSLPPHKGEGSPFGG